MRSLKLLMKVCVLLGTFIVYGCNGNGSNNASSTSTGEKSSNANKISLEAPIESVNLSENTITLAGITIKLSSATVHLNEANDVETANSNTLSSYLVGDVVKVEGVKESDSTFTASKLVTEVDDEVDENDGEEIEVEISGPIESFNSTSFVVLGHTITIEDDATFIKVADTTTFFATIQVGTIVQVEGDLVDGVILADEIEVGKDEDSAAEEAADGVEADDADDLTKVEICVGGPIEAINGESFTVLGVTVNLASDVEFEGISNKAAFLNAIAVGTYVKVEGDYIDGALLGDEVQFGKEDVVEIGLGGVVESINGETFVIHGKQIILDDDTIYVGFANGLAMRLPRALRISQVYFAELTNIENKRQGYVRFQARHVSWLES